MRNLAIDFGSKRVGLALSDAGGRFATPLEVISVTSSQRAIARILAVVEREGVGQLILGLPLNMDDSLGPQARNVIQWGRELAETSHLPVIFVDERLSSFEAEQSLISRKQAGEKITRKQKKSRLDAVAAAGFLQAFLDGKLPAFEPEENIGHRNTENTEK